MWLYNKNPQMFLWIVTKMLNQCKSPPCIEMMAFYFQILKFDSTSGIN
jgi:hypothetical protein